MKLHPTRFASLVEPLLNTSFVQSIPQMSATGRQKFNLIIDVKSAEILVVNILD